MGKRKRKHVSLLMQLEDAISELEVGVRRLS